MRLNRARLHRTLITVMLATAALHATATTVFAQAPSETIADSSSVDSTAMNMDAVYSRPFLFRSGGDLGVGGYVEANVESLNEGGISEGVSFQARRFTVFLSGAPSDHLRFLAELEFENGTEEINLEFASLDLVFNRSLMVRGGITMIPIGAFNQNHDGPRWNFVDRPISATQLLPATWSAAGFGLLGKFFTGSASISYEAYVTNGLNESIVSNSDQRTSLAAAKADPLRFEESFNGHPMFSGRTAISTAPLGEIGLSYAGGIYNLTQQDGVDLADPLWFNIAALDYSIGSFSDLISIRAEAAYVNVALPADSDPVYASGQLGGYTDVNVRLWQGSMLGFTHAACYASVRGEYVDFHLAQDGDEGASADETGSVTVGLALHPASGTIVRMNVRNTWASDLIGNPAVRTTALQLGITTYF